MRDSWEGMAGKEDNIESSRYLFSHNSRWSGDFYLCWKTHLDFWVWISRFEIVLGDLITWQSSFFFFGWKLIWNDLNLKLDELMNCKLMKRKCLILYILATHQIWAWRDAFSSPVGLLFLRFSSCGAHARRFRSHDARATNHKPFSPLNSEAVLWDPNARTSNTESEFKNSETFENLPLEIGNAYLLDC